MTTPPTGAPRPLRLPGSVAEVDASPEGPHIGAFFDLDGTLVAGFTVAAVTKIGCAAGKSARPSSCA